MTDHGTKPSNVIFGRFEQYQDGPEVTSPLSQPAMRLHFFGMLASFQRGRAGYISDCYLAAIDTGASSSGIVELLDAGLWERIDDGFQVRQLEVMRIATELAYHLAQQPLSTSASPQTSADSSPRVRYRRMNTEPVASRKGTNLVAGKRVAVPLDDGQHVQQLPQQLALWTHLFAETENRTTVDGHAEK